MYICVEMSFPLQQTVELDKIDRSICTVRGEVPKFATPLENGGN